MSRSGPKMLCCRMTPVLAALGFLARVALGAEQMAIPEGHRGNCAMCHGKQSTNTYVFDADRSALLAEFIGTGAPLTASAYRMRGGFVLDVTQPERSTLTVEFDSNAVRSTDALVTSFLRSSRFLDSQRFPTIRFVSTQVKKLMEDTYRIEGNLTLHGHTEPVGLDARFIGGGPDPVYGARYASFRASSELLCKNFGLTFCRPTDKIRLEMIVTGRAPP
jgi:polyisoprenoid-binding protein YceI